MTREDRQPSGELVARCQAGDRDAFRALFEQTFPDVQRILYRLAGPTPERADLVQEVYLGLWRSLGGFRGEAAFSTYLYGICLRVVRKRFRFGARFARLREALVRESTGAELCERPEVPLERAEEAAAVQRALEKLSFKHRTVLVLFEMEGLSGADIARQLGIPEKTVWTRLHHARKAFRRSFRWSNPSVPEPAPGANASRTSSTGG